MRREPRAVTLLEVLVSTFLVGLVLLVASELVRGYSLAVRHSSDKDRELGVVLETMDRLCSELAVATSVTPGLDRVAFERLSPNVASPAEGFPRGWQPRGRGRLLEVSYQLVEGRLDRVTGSRQTMATGIGGFSVTVEDRACRVAVSVLEDKTVRVLKGTAYRWPTP